MDPSSFGTVIPSRFTTLTLPNPLPHRPDLRVAVLDSPCASSSCGCVAAMWVPLGRESDWIFSTFPGHLQLLLSTPAEQHLCRLILVGNSPIHPHPNSYNSNLFDDSFRPREQDLGPLLLALSPKSAFGENGEVPEIPFLVYEDEVVRSSILEICQGPSAGEMLIENVELDIDGVREFRRRLRFKRMPNLVQTQIRIFPRDQVSFDFLDNVEFELDNEILVHPYLGPMVAGISVISSFLEGRVRDGVRPKALCLGVGGGALLQFLSSRLNFDVVGVEEDEEVLRVARKYFGLQIHESIRLCVGNGIAYFEKLAKDANTGCKFDVVMVDLDSSDAALGLCAPPIDFIEKSVLESARRIMFEEGVLIVNTIPFSEEFYGKLISDFHETFEELYEIDVGNGDNFVLIATKSRIGNSLDTCGTTVLDNLKSVVSTSYIDSIKKICKTDFPGF